MSEQTNNSQRQSIANFIKDLNEKNYAQANKYLEQAIHAKLKDKISQTKSQPIFKQS